MPAYDAPDDLEDEAAVTSVPEAPELADLDGGIEPILPESIRQRVISLAAGAMTGLPLDELPMPLRRVAKFAPNRRARLGGPVIAMQLAGDPLLRQRLATRVVSDSGDLGAAILEGLAPPAADPVEVAALAYLARPDGWRDLVERATDTVRAQAEGAATSDRIRDVEQRLARAEHDRAVARVEADKLRDELARLRDETSGLRDEVRSLGKSLRESQAKERKSTDMLASEKGRAARTTADHDAELRRLRAKLAEAETAAGAQRQSAKDARAVDDARLWLLLETIGQAAVGLRRELALDPTDRLPADFVADHHADRPDNAPGATVRALDADDPARLDQLLSLPKAHMIVDGYNVTKKGYGELSLEQQRNRLVAGAGGLVAQTRAEVTVVFDGAERVVGLPPAPRGGPGALLQEGRDRRRADPAPRAGRTRRSPRGRDLLRQGGHRRRPPPRRVSAGQ